MDNFMLNHKYDAILEGLNYTDVNLMNQQSDELMNRNLDSKCQNNNIIYYCGFFVPVNAMEFSFEVPQDARELPPSVVPDFVPIDA